jgi:hypothetical protein
MVSVFEIFIFSLILAFIGVFFKQYVRIKKKNATIREYKQLLKSDPHRALVLLQLYLSDNPTDHGSQTELDTLTAKIKDMENDLHEEEVVGIEDEVEGEEFILVENEELLVQNNEGKED